MLKSCVCSFLQNICPLVYFSKFLKLTAKVLCAFLPPLLKRSLALTDKPMISEIKSSNPVLAMLVGTLSGTP